jgi:hypothetical protein
MNAVQFDQPFYHFLDRMIREYGDYLYMLLVYASIPLIGWILSGGLRRRRRLPEPGNPPVIIVVLRQPAEPPPLAPPIIGRESAPEHAKRDKRFAA